MRRRGLEPPRAIRPYALPLKGLFALALREGWIDEDPARSLPSYKPKRKRAADPVRRDEYLTPDEVWAVVGELAAQQDRAMVLTMAMAGLRPGEAAALRWQDVDVRASTLRIVEARTMGVTGAPKSGSEMAATTECRDDGDPRQNFISQRADERR